LAASKKISVAPRRVSFAKIREPLEVPNLLALQTESVDWLLGNEAWRSRIAATDSMNRGEIPTTSGLEEIFEEISPIEDFQGTMSLSFRDHRFEPPKYSIAECKERDMTYAQPLFVTAEFTNNITGEIKSQTVFMGDFPVMTARGTFVINGTERVVVSQLVRSPGVYFSVSTNTTGNLDVRNNKAQIIPSRGSYLEFLTEWVKDDRKSVSRFGKPVLQVQVDRKTKVSATIFLKALGMSREEIQNTFADVYDSIKTNATDWEIDLDLINNTLDYDESRAFTTPVITKEDALKEMYRKVRGESGNADAAEAWLKSVYFDKKRYNLARVGRHKLNRKLGISVEENTTVLTKEDIVATMKYLLIFDLALKNKADITGSLSFKLKMDAAKVDVKIASDDIDDFQNRRIRSVGELIQNQVRIGLSRMERVVRERMSTQDVEAITPQTLINLRPVVSAIKEFFGASQLSQFMDQNNPLAGLAHKRRLSALGPGGIARERAQMEVRDVHPSHYGRMCPVENPRRSKHWSYRFPNCIRTYQHFRFH